MKNLIIDILQSTDKALTATEICELLGYGDVDHLKEVLQDLNELENDYTVYHTNKDKYMLFSNSHLKIGKLLSTSKDFAFVDIDGDEDVFVHSSNLNGAIHNDKVIVEITSRAGLKLEGRIVKIVDRSLDNVVGEIVNINGKSHLKLDEQKFKIDVKCQDTPTHWKSGFVSSYVIFILATTEFYKVPTTIVSRCQYVKLFKA